MNTTLGLWAVALLAVSMIACAQEKRSLGTSEMSLGDEGFSEFVERYQLASGGERIIVGAAKGKETLADATDLFLEIHLHYQPRRTVFEVPASGATEVEVYDANGDAPYGVSFVGLTYNQGVRKIDLTQAQIKRFVREYRSWLAKDGPTYFTYLNAGNHHVAKITQNPNGELVADLYEGGDCSVWIEMKGIVRLVVPRSQECSTSSNGRPGASVGS